MKTSAKKPAPRKESAEPKTTTTCISLHLSAPQATNVCVAGSFNDWHPSVTPMIGLEGGRWAKELVLPPGRHEYMFVIDGQWVPDPNALEAAPNPFGGYNSVLIIPGPPDFPPAAPRKSAPARRKSTGASVK